LPRTARVLGLADAPKELDGFPPFLLRLAPRHHLATSLSMVRRECGSRQGIVASEELVPESLSRIPGRDSAFWFAAELFDNAAYRLTSPGVLGW
jgi:hypothetical protein